MVRMFRSAERVNIFINSLSPELVIVYGKILDEITYNIV